MTWFTNAVNIVTYFHMYYVADGWLFHSFIDTYVELNTSAAYHTFPFPLYIYELFLFVSFCFVLNFPHTRTDNNNKMWYRWFEKCSSSPQSLLWWYDIILPIIAHEKSESLWPSFICIYFHFVFLTGLPWSSISVDGTSGGLKPYSQRSSLMLSEPGKFCRGAAWCATRFLCEWKWCEW